MTARMSTSRGVLNARGGRGPFGEKFTLFAEVLLTGVYMTLLMLLVVTWLPALCAGCAAVRRAADGDAVSVRWFLGRTGAAWRRLWVVGCAGLAVAAVLLADARLAWQGGVPGGPAVAVLLAALAALSLLVQVRLAGIWAASADDEFPPGPRRLLAVAASRTVRDISGSAIVLAALLTTALIGWRLAALIPVAAGPLAMAVTAAELRARSAA